MILAFLALLTIHAYAATPQRAVLQIVYPESKKPPVVRRVNVAGSYATVLTGRGMMEGSPVTEAILVQHFSFGWQPLDALNFGCRLHDHALGRRTEMRLMPFIIGPPVAQLPERPARISVAASWAMYRQTLMISVIVT